MARAREVPDLDCADSYAIAAARVVAVRARELFDHASGVLDTTDIERVHDMRVASRRLRAAMEIFEPCFPRKPFRAALREVKAIADALGERRDRDVAIAALEKIAARMSSADQAGLGLLIDRLRREQAEANEALAPIVGEEPLAALRERLDELVAAARSSDGGEDRMAAGQGPVLAPSSAGAQDSVEAPA
jgi:CHAD domain-containing protein